MEGTVFGLARKLARKAGDAAFRREARQAVAALEDGAAEAAAVIGCRTAFLAGDLEAKMGGRKKIFVFDSDDMERNRMIAVMPSCTYGSEAELLPYALSRSGVDALDLAICRPDLWSMPPELYGRVISGIRWSLRDSGLLIVITSSRRAAPALRECFGSVKARASFASGFPVFTYQCRPVEDQAGGFEGILGS